MHIGKPGEAKTAIATADAAGVTVRGRNLVGDLMGRLSFTAYFYFLTTGREPTETQRYFLDLLLVAIAEHGLTPTAIAARMTLAAAPDSIEGAVAAGLLGAGRVILGSSAASGAVLIDAKARVAAGATPDAAAAAIASEIHARGGKMPGFGHPMHKPVDPRADKIVALAVEKKVAGQAIDLAQRFTPAVAKAWGRPLPMNVSMAIAACLIDLDFPPAMIKAIPILARAAGLLAHLAEEQQRPIGFAMAGAAEDAIRYDGGKP
ncbi:MAG TPA: citryl-CoA lyase [Bauldia sp.]|nr:citryl-CoA lyase [Bauldia sp.]